MLVMGRNTGVLSTVSRTGEVVKLSPLAVGINYACMEPVKGHVYMAVDLRSAIRVCRMDFHGALILLKPALLERDKLSFQAMPSTCA